jgi:DNA-directed RNA polymerase specialized sigma24 family protein
LPAGQDEVWARDAALVERSRTDAEAFGLLAVDDYRPPTAPFAAWLHRIAANAVTDHLRARRPTTPLDPTTHALPGLPERQLPRRPDVNAGVR